MVAWPGEGRRHTELFTSSEKVEFAPLVLDVDNDIVVVVDLRWRLYLTPYSCRSVDSDASI